MTVADSQSVAAGSAASRMLNVGCGGAYHAAWINLDSDPVSYDVLAHDLRRPLPFETASMDVCYASHVLEHLDADRGHALLREFHRVLRPGGVVRIVVPDLEDASRSYLRALDAAVKDPAEHASDHRWAVIELVDQLVRDRPGGQMAEFLAGQDRNLPFVRARIGPHATRSAGNAQFRQSLVSRVQKRFYNVRDETLVAIAGVMAGERGRQAVREGLFRQSGEVHRTMYDRVSLSRALELAGFCAVTVVDAMHSAVPAFETYELDVVDRQVRIPGSLYVEGLR